MSSMRWKILLAMVVVFIAGAVIGVVSRVQAVVPGAEPKRHSWLVSELGLTPEQSQKMREIWSGVMASSGKQHREQREALLEEHQSELRAMLTPEQQQRYDALRADLERRLEELERQRRQAFEDAVEQTRQILTPAQREKYEQILILKERERSDHGRRRGFDGGRSSTRPSRDETEQRENTEQSVQ